MAVPGLSTSRREPVPVAGGHAATRFAAGLLGLAAAPTFTAMTVLSAMPAAMPDICSAQAMPPMGTMTAMYALMSVFHLGPWLRLIGRRRCA